MRRKTAALLMGLLLGHGGSTGGAIGHGGAGGTGTGGAAGAMGSGGAGGASPCQAILALNRSCATATDCFAAEH